jgi:hypothetical protein
MSVDYDSAAGQYLVPVITKMLTEWETGDELAGEFAVRLVALFRRELGKQDVVNCQDARG